MIDKAISLILITGMLATVDGNSRISQEDVTLRVYLPREVAVEGSVPSLGQVAIIRGSESLVAKAGKIALGRISMPGQGIVVDRSVVLSRLACNGIPGSVVSLSGAEKTTVKRKQQIISGAELVKLARSFLGENPPGGSICRSDPVRMPEDIVLKNTLTDIKLIPRLAESSIPNQAGIEIGVLAGDKELTTRQVSFRLKYAGTRAVAIADIPAGGTLSPENVRIETVVSDYCDPGDGTVAYGLVARRSLPANTVIRPNMVAPARPRIVLKRNQNVVISIDRFGLLITAVGKTMQEGRTGEYIKVRNVDSQRIILARVNEDGTCEPVF
jgi:flagella basal body P-ring formation protein FlgA